MIVAAGHSDRGPNAACERSAWLEVRIPTHSSIQLIDSRLDRGEREALALAQEISADLVLVDDRAARREATALGLRITGTLGVLRLGAERGLVDVRATIPRLAASGFYVSDVVLRAAFGSVIRFRNRCSSGPTPQYPPAP